jgi:hypothetical protein
MPYILTEDGSFIGTEDGLDTIVTEDFVPFFPEHPIIDKFGYAGQPVNLGGLGDWVTFLGGLATNLRVGTNFANGISPSGATCSDYTGTTYGPDCEAYMDIVQKDTTNPTFVARLAVRIQNPTLNTAGGRQNYEIQVAGNGNWSIFENFGGVSTQLGSTVVQAIVNGDKMGIRVVGSRIEAWWWDSSGSGWNLVNAVTNTDISAAGPMAIVLQGGASTLWTVDNFGGGTI